MPSTCQAASGLVVLVASTAAAGSALAQGVSPRGDRATASLVQAPALPGAQAISSQDRVYTADQSSNTVSVINPKTDEVLGTIALGQDRLDQVLGPVDKTQVNVHGLGFSRDGRRLDVISVTSNAAQLIDTQTNSVARPTTYVGRSPHEGFVAPDGRALWVAVRGERYVSVISTHTGREVQRIATADGPSKVVFSPDGRLAYVNHQRSASVDVIRVRDRRVIHRITGTAPGSSDEALSPDGRELWLGHPTDGKTTVVDAKRFRVLEILDTGPRTNHPTFVTKRDGHAYAYVTVGGLNQTLVYRRGGAHPLLVRRIQNSGEAPHGIWPSPDNTRLFVALQKSDAVDVIDTATDRVIDTLHVGQDPQALVYVAGAVRHGSGTQHLTRQGLGRRVETMPVTVPADQAAAKAKLTVRAVDTLDELDFTARGLAVNGAFTLYGVRPDGSTDVLRQVTADAKGGVDEALAFATYFGVYDHAVLVAQGQRP